MFVLMRLSQVVFLSSSHFPKYSFLSFSLYGLQLFLFPAAKYTRKSKGFLGKKRKLAITILSVAVPLFLVSLLAYMWLMKKRKTKGNKITCFVVFT